jgi:hypothetical protein
MMGAFEVVTLFGIGILIGYTIAEWMSSRK